MRQLVLYIHGKGGNTELLVQAFVDGAKKNNSVEVISVVDYKVNILHL